MGVGEWIAIGIIALIVGGAVAYIVKSKKAGVRCIGCADGSKCKGSCDGCKGCCGCHTEEEKEDIEEE